MTSDELHYPHHALEKAAATVDFLAIAAAGPAATFVYKSFFGIPASGSIYLGISLMIAAIFVFILSHRGLYELEALLQFDRQIRSMWFYWTIAFATMIALAYLMKSSHDLSRGATTTLYLLGGLTLSASRIFWIRYVKSELARGALGRRCVALLTWGEGDLLEKQKRLLEQAGFLVEERMAARGHDIASMSSAVQTLVSKIRGSKVQEIVVFLPHNMLGLLPIILDALRATPLPTRVMPDEQLSSLLFQRRKGFGNFALVEVKREPLSGRERALKRSFDLFLAAGALIALAPLMLMSIFVIRLDSPGPVLFKQMRRGFNGRTFKILKLRTMHVLEDGPAIIQATKSDRRVTRVGRWLRRTSIDELPQLWNVIRGDMSIVGPRPHAVAHDEFYDELIENYAHRQHVKPGLTGWAQVHGFRGETPRIDDMKMRVQHDLWYVSNWSFGLDLRIVLMTCTRLLGEGAY